MKTIEGPRQPETELPDAEALIKEARQRQRRRWLFIGIIVIIAMIVIGVSYAIVNLPNARARHTGRSSPTKAVSRSRSHSLMAYVLNQGAGTVTPINTVTNRAGKPIKVGKQAQYIGVSLDGKTVYVGSGDLSTNANANVIPIPVGTNRTGKPVKLSVVKMGDWCTADIATTPNGKTDYLDVPSEGIVLPINVATGVAGKAIRVAPGPSAITIVN
jgi:hypothetical protein